MCKHTSRGTHCFDFFLLCLFFVWNESLNHKLCRHCCVCVYTTTIVGRKKNVVLYHISISTAYLTFLHTLTIYCYLIAYNSLLLFRSFFRLSQPALLILFSPSHFSSFLSRSLFLLLFFFLSSTFTISAAM